MEDLLFMNKKIKILTCFLVGMCLTIAGIYAVHKKNKAEAENTIITYDALAFEEAVGIHYTAKEAAELEGIQLRFRDRERCDMTDLKKFPKLKAVSIHAATTEKIEAISKIEGLEYLNIISYEGTDITAIRDMESLKCLDVTGPYEQIKFIGEITQLETLALSYTTIPDLLFLKNLKNLTRLEFEKCDIESLNGLEKLPQLEYFRLLEISEEASLREYEKIGDLKNLKQLSLFGCRAIEDVSFLSNLSKLELLTLRELGTTDISVVANLSNYPSLGMLALSDDIIEKNQELNQNIEKILEERGVDVTPDYRDSKRSHDPFW